MVLPGRPVFWMFSCLWLSPVAPSRGGEAADALRKEVVGQIETVETEALLKQGELTNKYVAALDALEKRFETAGDIDGIVHLREERAAIQKDGRSTGHADKPLAELRGRYRAAGRVISGDLAMARKKLDTALAQKVKDEVIALTKEGKVDEALALRKDGDELIREVSVRSAMPAFFGVDVLARRVAYVIDFSQSMRADGRDVLMREELAKAVRALPDTTQYQLIFFAGPVWTAGDTVTSSTVEHNGEKYRWVMRNLWQWSPEGPLMKPVWLEADETRRRSSLAQIRDTPLIGGTDWESPLRMAMNMEPPPEVICFMTDGAMEKRDMGSLAKGIAAEAKAKGVIINTVNMMVTDHAAVEALGEMAEITGGDMTRVEQGGGFVRMPGKSER